MIPQIPACVGSVPLHCLTHTHQRKVAFVTLFTTLPPHLLRGDFSRSQRILSCFCTGALQHRPLSVPFRQTQPEALGGEMKVYEQFHLSGFLNYLSLVLKYATNPVDWP